MTHVRQCVTKFFPSCLYSTGSVRSGVVYRDQSYVVESNRVRGGDELRKTKERLGKREREHYPDIYSSRAHASLARIRTYV